MTAYCFSVRGVVPVKAVNAERLGLINFENERVATIKQGPKNNSYTLVLAAAEEDVTKALVVIEVVWTTTRSPNGKDYGIFALNHGPKTLSVITCSKIITK